MLFEKSIETERLLLRAVELSDWEAIFEMNTDPHVMRYIGDGSISPLSRDEFAERFEQRLGQHADDEYGLAVVVLKVTNQFIGVCWLCYEEFLSGVELGYRYRRDAWRKGFATEAGRAVLQAGFGLSQLEEVLAYTHPENTASIRVLEKLGFEHIKEQYYPKLTMELPVYQLVRESYI
jgi:RimJ/RimL family protein N-acetyltransferase